MGKLHMKKGFGKSIEPELVYRFPDTDDEDLRNTCEANIKKLYVLIKYTGVDLAWE